MDYTLALSRILFISLGSYQYSAAFDESDAEHVRRSRVGWILVDSHTPWCYHNRPWGEGSCSARLCFIVWGQRGFLNLWHATLLTSLVCTEVVGKMFVESMHIPLLQDVRRCTLWCFS